MKSEEEKTEDEQEKVYIVNCQGIKKVSLLEALELFILEEVKNDRRI